MKKISVVSTAYDENKNLPKLCFELVGVLKNVEYDFEIIIVDNGSNDGSLKTLKELSEKYSPNLKYVRLTRNFGHQGGLISGLSMASGDAVITMDADLQHPPIAIRDMIECWEQGNMVVNSIRAVSKTSVKRNIANRIFYKGMKSILGFDIGEGDFRLIDKRVLVEFLNIEENEKFLRGLIPWLGFRSTNIDYKINPRIHGVSKFSSKDLFNFAYQGLTSFSVRPLRLLFNTGLYIFIPSSLYLFVMLILGILYKVGMKNIILPPGWSTITVTIIFFGSINLLAVGILGEYIGRIFTEVKNRPNFIVEDENISTPGE